MLLLCAHVTPKVHPCVGARDRHGATLRRIQGREVKEECIVSEILSKFLKSTAGESRRGNGESVWITSTHTQPLETHSTVVRSLLPHASRPTPEAKSMRMCCSTPSPAHRHTHRTNVNRWQTTLALCVRSSVCAVMLCECVCMLENLSKDAEKRLHTTTALARAQRIYMLRRICRVYLFTYKCYLECQDRAFITMDFEWDVAFYARPGGDFCKLITLVCHSAQKVLKLDNDLVIASERARVLCVCVNCRGL